MKKILFCLMALVMMAGCSKEDEPTFNYDLDILIGTWRVTHVMQDNGAYLDVTTTIAEMVFEPTYATFNADGTYYGSGEFGTGSGTYKAVGNTIITYVGGEEYLKYDVLSLNVDQCELKMYQTGEESSIKIKCKKQ